MVIKRILFLLVTLSVGLSASAKVVMSPLFTDNMVFQQRTQAPVWGKADPGATVTVKPSWNGKVYSCITGADGKWSVKIRYTECCGLPLSEASLCYQDHRNVTQRQFLRRE